MTMLGGRQKLEQLNVERKIFRNFKIENIKITKDDFFDLLIFEFICSFFLFYFSNNHNV